jgi:hypothetical protein
VGSDIRYLIVEASNGAEGSVPDGKLGGMVRVRADEAGAPRTAPPCPGLGPPHASATGLRTGITPKKHARADI